MSEAQDIDWEKLSSLAVDMACHAETIFYRAFVVALEGNAKTNEVMPYIGVRLNSTERLFFDVAEDNSGFVSHPYKAGVSLAYMTALCLVMGDRDFRLYLDQFRISHPSAIRAKLEFGKVCKNCLALSETFNQALETESPSIREDYTAGLKALNFVTHILKSGSPLRAPY